MDQPLGSICRVCLQGLVVPELPMDSDEIDVKASSAVLQAASFLIGEECAQVNDMFMACKRKHSDPVQCAEAGMSVSLCVNRL